MFANYAVIDEYLNVISGSTEFFKFMGALNFSSLLTQVSDRDAGTLRSACKHVFNSNKEKRLQLEVLNNNGEYRPCYLTLSPNTTAENGRTIVVNIYDIDQTINDISVMKRHMDIMQMVAGDDNTILFEYTPFDRMLSIFRCDSTNTYNIYSGNVNDWSDEIIYGDRVAPNNKEQFRNFVDDLKRGSRTLHAELSFDLFGDKSIKPYVIEGMTVINNTIVDAIGGSIRYKDASNKADILSEFSKDFMTGVLDKRSIIKYAKDRIETRNGEDVTLAILDLDHFKDVNDVLGHSKGDDVIIKFADIIKSCIGNAGAVGRFGGDEFMVVIDDIKDQLQIREFFRAIRSTTEMEFKGLGDDSKIDVTTSIGVVPINNLEGEISYDAMFKTADYCLYTAKEYGRNRYLIYDDRSKKNLRMDGTMSQNKFEKTVRNNTFMLSITEKLFNEGTKCIEDVIREIGERLELDNVVVYYGEGLKPFAWWGDQEEERLSAQYLFEDNYVSNFDENNVYALSNSPTLGGKMPNAYKYLEHQSIYSCLQFLIKDEDKVLGLISYELTSEPGRYWHDDESNLLTIISQVMAQMLKKEK